MWARDTSSMSSAASVASTSSSLVNVGGEGLELDKASCVGCASVISIDTSLSPFLNIQARTPLPILFHSDFRGHITRLSGTAELHQESPERVQHLFARLCEESSRFPLQVQILSTDEDIPQSTLEQLARVHDSEYVSFLHGLTTRYSLSAPEYKPELEVMRFSPLVVSRMFSEDTRREYFGSARHLSSGTRFGPGTFAAILRAAGAVTKAVHMVMGDDHPSNRAFCLVRPPGHHAGTRGYDITAGGCGFCIINNVMVGAAEALMAFPGTRVAIVDIDIHHGNGTEEIIRKRFAGQPILYCSTHLHETIPGDSDLDFFPGTGAECDEEQILNVPLIPLWRQSQPEKDKKRKAGRAASVNAKRRKGSDGSATSPFPCPEGSPSPRELAGPLQGREGFRYAIRNKVIPKLQQFKPDLLIISAGFDGGHEDEGNMLEGVQGMDLSDLDFAWCTEMLVEQSGATKVVSVLEGGYGKFSQRYEMYDTTPLVSSCLAHLSSLVEKK